MLSFAARRRANVKSTPLVWGRGLAAFVKHVG